MARGVNRATIIGNLGADPETRYSQGGQAVAKIRVATSESWKDKQTGDKVEKTEWHSITFFGRLAEVAGEYLRKGSKVYVEGSLSTSSWEKDGQKHYKTEIVAREMQMLDGRQEGGEPRQQQPQKPQQQALPDDFDDDIPFAWLLPIPFAPMLLEMANAAQTVL